jgi:hypothetical protein
METVEQDFRFEIVSRIYGEFLCEVHPDAVLVDVTQYYFGTPGDVVISATTTEDVAMLLKLKYGAHLVKRPVRHSSGPYTMKVLKSRYLGDDGIKWDWCTLDTFDGITFNDL